MTFDPADFDWHPRCQRLELSIAAQYDQDYKIMFHIDGPHAGNETESDEDGGVDVFGTSENLAGKLSYKRHPSPPPTENEVTSLLNDDFNSDES